MPDAFLGRLGWALLILTLILVIGTALSLPYIMTILHLVFPTKWVTATRVVVQITFGSWVATVAMSIARIIVWLRAVYSKTFGTRWASERSDVMYVRDFSLWLLGIMTALAAYMTVWVS